MNKKSNSGVISPNNSHIESILKPIFRTGKITRSDQEKLLSLTLSDTPLLPQEMQRINQVIFSLQSGRFKVVD